METEKDVFIRKRIYELSCHPWYKGYSYEKLKAMAEYMWNCTTKWTMDREPREITSETYERADKRQSKEIMNFVGRH